MKVREIRLQPKSLGQICKKPSFHIEIWKEWFDLRQLLIQSSLVDLRLLQLQFDSSVLLASSSPRSPHSARPQGCDSFVLRNCPCLGWLHIGSVSSTSEKGEEEKSVSASRPSSSLLRPTFLLPLLSDPRFVRSNSSAASYFLTHRERSTLAPTEPPTDAASSTSTSR